MKITPSKQTLTLKSRADDLEKELRAAQIEYQRSAIDALDAYLAAKGIQPGTKVVIVDVDDFWGEITRTPAFYMGAHFEYGEARPVLKKIKKDGTASANGASFSMYNSDLEPFK